MTLGPHPHQFRGSFSKFSRGSKSWQLKNLGGGGGGGGGITSLAPMCTSHSVHMFEGGSEILAKEDE